MTDRLGKKSKQESTELCRSEPIFTQVDDNKNRFIYVGGSRGKGLSKVVASGMGMERQGSAGQRKGHSAGRWGVGGAGGMRRRGGSGRRGGRRIGDRGDWDKGWEKNEGVV